MGKQRKWKIKYLADFFSCEGNDRHLCGLFCLFPWFKSWSMSETERYLKEAPRSCSMHVLSPLNGQMQGFPWLDDHLQAPKHGKKEGFVTSCLCLLTLKTGYKSAWTALVMVSVALTDGYSLKVVCQQLSAAREEVSFSCASWSIETIQRFLLAVQTITRFGKLF